MACLASESFCGSTCTCASESEAEMMCSSGCISSAGLYMLRGATQGYHATSWPTTCLCVSRSGLLPGLALLGIGLPLSFQVCTIYYNRLTCHSLPAREVIVSSFLPVGSMAMAAW
jgi:hypothetical protein